MKTPCMLLGLGLLALSLVSCQRPKTPEGTTTPTESVIPAEQQGPLSKTKPAPAAPTTPTTPTTPAPPTTPTTPPKPTKPTGGAATTAPAAAPAKPFVPSAPGKRIARVSVPGPYVALTFDDGPSASLTPQVLDILRRNGAHATFFVLGQNASRNKSILARAAAEGHEIGSHTWSHIKMTGSSQEKIFSELDRTASVIESATGSRPKVMRPPYGAVNSNLVNLVFGRYGTPAILWDVDTEDWRHPGVGVVVRRAVGNAKPGSIILMHDIHASTLAAVEDTVKGLQARGFKLVTVSQLISLARRAAKTADAPAFATPAAASEQEAAPAAPAERPMATPPAEGAGSSSIGTAPAETSQEPAVSPAQGSAGISAGETSL